MPPEAEVQEDVGLSPRSICDCPRSVAMTHRISKRKTDEDELLIGGFFPSSQGVEEARDLTSPRADPARRLVSESTTAEAATSHTESVSSQSNPAEQEEGQTMVQLRPGDIVHLHGLSAPPELRGMMAVVTKAGEGERSCTVVALNHKHQGVGECWPNVRDVALQAEYLRLGARVRVDRLASQARRALNGSRGEIAQHPRQAHPCFVSKADGVDPQLTVCVRLDRPWQGKRSLLLEPRHLLPEGGPGLSDAVESLCALVQDLSDNGIVAPVVAPKGR